MVTGSYMGRSGRWTMYIRGEIKVKKVVALSFCIHGLPPRTHTLPGMGARDVPFSQTGHDISFCTFMSHPVIYSSLMHKIFKKYSVKKFNTGKLIYDYIEQWHTSVAALAAHGTQTEWKFYIVWVFISAKIAQLMSKVVLREPMHDLKPVAKVYAWEAKSRWPRYCVYGVPPEDTLNCAHSQGNCLFSKSAFLIHNHYNI